MRRRLFELIVGLGIMASGAAAAQSPSSSDRYGLLANATGRF
jgi:hypothetical protein